MTSTNRLIQRCVPVLVALVLGGCSWERQPAQTGLEAVAPALSRARALRLGAAQVALAQVGVPYRWGGARPDGFDCSGLVHFAYAAQSVAVPRTAAAQRRASTPIPLASARAGDLLFFGGAGHVGVYLGDGRFVHAPSTGKRVTIASLDKPYYRRTLSRVGRLPVGD